jgi:RHS repeat-associated protein
MECASELLAGCISAGSSLRAITRRRAGRASLFISSSTNRYLLGGTSYDADGNVLNDDFNTYTWDAEGKQLSNYGGEETFGFTYDAFGHMVELAVNGTYTRSYMNMGKFRFSATGQTAGYSETPLPGGSIASQNGGNTGIQIADWLGTIRGNSNYTGGIVNSTGARAPFGEGYAGAPPEAFTGQDSDGNRGNPIYWFPERQYVSTQGRWISPDPAGLAAVNPSNPQSWNRYAYVGNSPLNNVDALGFCPSGSYNAGPNAFDAASGTDACGGIAVNAPVVDWVWTNGEWLGLDGWSTWDGLIQRGPIANSILTGEDSPYSGSLQSQIASLLSGIMPCQKEFGAPCVSIGSNFTTVPGYQAPTAEQIAYLQWQQGLTGLFWDAPGPPSLCREFPCYATISGPPLPTISAVAPPPPPPSFWQAIQTCATFLPLMGGPGSASLDQYPEGQMGTQNSNRYQENNPTNQGQGAAAGNAAGQAGTWSVALGERCRNRGRTERDERRVDWGLAQRIFPSRQLPRCLQ